jgi:putative tricarboxylic transport membrane protein
MEKRDRVTGYILLIIGVITAWSSVHLSMGSVKHPGSGFLPFGLALCLIALSLVLIFKSWRGKTPSTPFWPQRTWLRPLLGVFIFISYALVIQGLGFFLSTLLFLVIWMRLIEQVRWRTLISISITTTAGLYFIFVFFLEVPLPMGLLKW